MANNDNFNRILNVSDSSRIFSIYFFSFTPRVNEGFASMKVGEKAKLLIRSDYGYGGSAMGANIPANSNLVFDVELLGFQEKEKEKWEVGILWIMAKDLLLCVTNNDASLPYSLLPYDYIDVSR